MTEPTDADFDAIRDAVLEAARQAASERGFPAVAAISPCLVAAIMLSSGSAPGMALLESICRKVILARTPAAGQA